MYIDFSSLFHHSSRDLRDKGRVHIPADDAEWPKEWLTIEYKTYPRASKIPLSRDTIEDVAFSHILTTRRSRRDFDGRAIDKKKMSQLLLYACGITDTANPVAHRTYPSGGGRFPIEIYPLVFVGTEDIPAGVYHYDVKNHALDVLWPREFTSQDIGNLFSYPWIQKSSFALVFTAVFRRNQIKYGERGYRYILLEAGHISENIYLTAEALKLRCCAMGAMHEKNIEELLDIDGVYEAPVHSIILG